MLESQRGQTMPFWVIGVLVSLSMLFFLANYANAVAWQVRAQNAADAAASGALSVQANVWNEYSVILYATAVDEYRVRVLNQAILNTLYGKGGCSVSTCQSDFNSLVNEYAAALNGFTDDIHLLDQANNMTQAGQTTDEQKALSLMGSQCASGSNVTDYACQFAITSLAEGAQASNGNNGGGITGPGDNEIDVIACKKLSYFGSALLNMKGASYQVLGRAAAAIVPANSETFNPGTQINAGTGQPYQPIETQWAQSDQSSPAYQVDFSGLNAHLNWYHAGAVRPFAPNPSGQFSCK